MIPTARRTMDVARTGAMGLMAASAMGLLGRRGRNCSQAKVEGCGSVI